VSPRGKNLVAIVVGALLLGLPAAAFNIWLNKLVQARSQEEVEIEARRTLLLAEYRLGRAMAALDQLAKQGVNSCAPDHFELLQRATFETIPVKEFAVLAPDGSTLCSVLSDASQQPRLISSEPIEENSKVLLELLRLREGNGQIVRVVRPGEQSANKLAAIVPVELLTPRISSRGEMVRTYIRIVTRGGSTIGPHSDQAAQSERGNLVAQLRSERFAFDVIVALPREKVAADLEELRALGTVGAGLLALVILVVSLLWPRRQPENPITTIEQALKAGEFVPYYQPIVDITTGRLRGAEVLVRWRKRDGTVISPAIFIPLAESSGLILDITRALMRQVCKEAGKALACRPHLKISFNLVASHLAGEEIVRDVGEIFNGAPLWPTQIVLEVTERQPLENLTEARRVIAALQGMGARVAIDDVGTGHSGLSYLLKLGVDIIKIDKMFVDCIGVDRNSSTIISTLIDMARNMRMEITAEGVENFEQVVHLRELGVHAAQGYVFAPPLPCASFLQLVEAIDPLPKPAREERTEELPAAALRLARSA